MEDKLAKILSILSSGTTPPEINSGNYISGNINSGKNTSEFTNSGKDISGNISASTPTKVVGEEEMNSIPFTPKSGEEEKNQYQHPNFRNIFRNTYHQGEESPNMNFGLNTRNSPSYFQRRFSTSSTVLSTNSNIVRSIANIDPTKSGVCLTFLDIPHFYKWLQDLGQLQKKHPHEDLPWDYVTSEVSISGNNYSQNAYDCDVHIAIGDNNHHDDDKIYSNIDNVFKGLNPGCNITHILSYFDRKTALSSVFTQPARPTVVKEISRRIPGAWNQVQFLVFLRKFFDPGIIHVPLLLLILLLNSSKGLTWVLLM
jgi:hypothetical protein